MPAPVEYEELPGSPEINMDRKGGTGKRVVKIAWANIDAFFSEIFPDPSTGYLYGAIMPGAPWQVATTVGVKPFVETKARYDVDDWTGWHDFAEITVNYTVPTDDQQQQSGPGGDGTGPGGSQGSTGGQEVTFISHKVSIGGEFLTYPNNSIQWQSPSSLTPPDPPKITSSLVVGALAAETKIRIESCVIPRTQNLRVQIEDEFMVLKGVVTNRDRTVTLTVQRGAPPTLAADHNANSVVFISNPDAGPAKLNAAPNIACAVTTPLIEHNIEWNYVFLPPWLAMRQLVGKVNAYTFAGAPPETMLFLGGECSRDITSSGVKAWKMGYKFSEKNQNALNPLLPMGWNYFLRPNGENAGTFQRLRKRLPMPNGFAAATSLDSGATVLDSTITVASTGAPFPQTGQFFIQVDNEIMAVGGILSPTVWVVMRGLNGTTVATHASGAIVTQVAGGVYDLADLAYLFLVL